MKALAIALSTAVLSFCANIVIASSLPSSHNQSINTTQLTATPKSITVSAGHSNLITIDNVGEESTQHVNVNLPSDYAPYIDPTNSVLHCDTIPVNNLCQLNIAFLNTLPQHLMTSSGTVTSSNAPTITFSISEDH